MAHMALQTRSGFFTGTQIQATRPAAQRLAAAPLAINARYRGKGTDLSLVEQFKRNSSDSGSPEYQIARLSARVQQLTSHLQTHTKDFGGRRGLMTILSKRKQLLLYLQRTDRAKYEKVLAELNIRPLKTEAGVRK